ncbi:unnamed protein product [Spirodela intermedia]|uniref:Uncharacterized protein n=1 Tax=Spirodela intermedia TaxID=51605 RepID=A0A7I8IYW0_SPIIN|nr:unnamed protein product [Spirodela intermedia]CAA6663067.1 unnamed protein product [Spirodela intermedia]
MCCDYPCCYTKGGIRVHCRVPRTWPQRCCPCCSHMLDSFSHTLGTERKMALTRLAVILTIIVAGLVLFSALADAGEPPSPSAVTHRQLVPVVPDAASRLTATAIGAAGEPSSSPCSLYDSNAL